MCELDINYINVDTEKMSNIYSYLSENNIYKNLDSKKYNLDIEDIIRIIINRQFKICKIINYYKFNRDNNELIKYLNNYSDAEKKVVLKSLIEICDIKEKKPINKKLKNISSFYNKLNKLGFPIACINSSSFLVELSFKEKDNFITDGEIVSTTIERASFSDFFHNNDRDSLKIKFKNQSFILYKKQEYETLFNDETYNLYSADLYTITPDIDLLSNINRENLFMTRPKELQGFIDIQKNKRILTKCRRLSNDINKLIKNLKITNNLIEESNSADFIYNREINNVNLEHFMRKEELYLLKNILANSSMNKEKSINFTKKYKKEKKS